jgi:hypothetical protein
MTLNSVFELPPVGVKVRVSFNFTLPDRLSELAVLPTGVITTFKVDWWRASW